VAVWLHARSEGPPFCSFCGKGRRHGRNVVRREDGRYICDECVDRVIDALAHEGAPVSEHGGGDRPG
jgi:hypothetical protein